MPDLAVTPVVTQRVDAIYVTHQPRKIGPVRPHHHVVMITHQVIGIGCRLKTGQPLGKHRQPLTSIFIVIEYRLAPASA